MAENKKQGNDPILNFLYMASRLLLRTLWAVVKLVALIIRDIIVVTPVLYRGAKHLVKSVRKRFLNKPDSTEKKEKAALVREIDAAGRVVRIALYKNSMEATNALAKDFLRIPGYEGGVPEHTLEMFDISYTKAELDHIREDIADGELRNFDVFHTLEGVTKQSEGSLMTEYFKNEQGLPPFSELDAEGLFMYDLFLNRQEEQKEIAAWEAKVDKSEFSLESMLNCIAGRSKISINDFAQILNNHPDQFGTFLNNENALVLLDAISHHPDISRMGGMSVDHIASLDSKHIQPINLLVLRLIGSTQVNPNLADKALRTIKRIQTEADWLPRDKEAFETKYDDKICSELIRKYAASGCNSVLRAMMATTYIKTLDDRNISQRSHFERQVAEFSRTEPAITAMRQFDEGKLTPANYTLPLYFGMIDRVSNLRHELSVLVGQMSQNGLLVNSDLFGENVRYLELTQKIREYSDVMNLCHHSLEVQTLDIQKMTNIRVALSSGRAMGMDGNIRPEIVNAAEWIISKYVSNPAVMARIEEILLDTPLQSLCQTLSEPANQPDMSQTQNKEEIKEQQEQAPIILEEVHEISGEEHQAEQQVDYATGKDFASATRSYGIEGITSSTEIIKSFATKFTELFPETEKLEPSDYNQLHAEGLRVPALTTADPEHLRNLAICMAGVSLGYLNANNTTEELLISSGYSPDEIAAMSPQAQKEISADIADFWLACTENKNQTQTPFEINWETGCWQATPQAAEEITPNVGFKR